MLVQENNTRRNAMKEKKVKKRYDLVITPALEPAARHEIEKALTRLGYEVTGGIHSMGNLVVSCSACNFAKNKKSPAEWNKKIRQPVLF